MSHMLIHLLSQRERKGGPRSKNSRSGRAHSVRSGLSPPRPALCSKSHLISLCDGPCWFSLKVGHAASSEALKRDWGPRRQWPDRAGGFMQNLSCVSIFNWSTPAQFHLGPTEAARGYCWEIQLLSSGVSPHSPGVKRIGRAILSRFDFHL